MQPQPAGRLGTPVAMAVAVGFVVRALFLWRHPLFRGDALVYGELARHMIKEHVYGLIDAGVLKPTLIRLPGYPLFLAACFEVFGDANYLSVLWMQVLIDLASCGLIAGTAARIAGKRAGMWALWLAVLCPFTANYSVVVVPECVSIFCVALAFYGLVRWVEGWRSGFAGMKWAALVGVALAAAVLLRPDQGLLAVAVVPAMLWVGLRGRGGDRRVRIAPAAVASAMVALPLCLWAVRNWRVFHVVQPIAPKYANDPGEEVPYGFMRWYRTWAVGFPSTVKVYWEYDGETISMNDLPRRAVDSAEQRAETARIIAQYNQESASTPQVDAEFAQLAEQRVRANPLRYYVELPVGRLLDMWFRPRIEYMKIPLDWWRLRLHPWGSLRAYGMGALNVFYLGMACVGVWMWRRRGGVVVWSMAAFVVLRCALLLTIDNSEPRYTMECYSVVIVLAAMAVGAERHTSGAKAPELLQADETRA
ncbi:MAG TPA: glycosyltransferase family 39 protein [Acidobacteriaceae bacterium]|nr:glycosyltransferase family 39 protein [Acidobacteriaceae bacterium]